VPTLALGSRRRVSAAAHDIRLRHLRLPSSACSGLLPVVQGGGKLAVSLVLAEPYPQVTVRVSAGLGRIVGS